MVLETEADAPFCAFKLNHLNRGSLSFLFQNPFIFSDKGSTKVVFFADHNITRTELEHIAHEYQFPKLDSLVIISCSPYDTEATRKSESHARSSKGQDIFDTPLSSACMLLQEQGLKVKTYEVSALKHLDTPANHRIAVSQLSVAHTRWFERSMPDLKHSTPGQQTLNVN